MKINYLVELVKKLQINNPTFVASDKEVLKKCQKLSEIFGTNYAYIERDEKHGSSVVLCGRINPDAIFITPRFKSAASYREDMELIWCAGAHNIYTQERHVVPGGNEFNKLPNPFYHPKLHYI